MTKASRKYSRVVGFNVTEEQYAAIGQLASLANMPKGVVLREILVHLGILPMKEVYDMASIIKQIKEPK